MLDITWNFCVVIKYIYIHKGQVCTILGFGRTVENGKPSNVLKQASVPIVDYRECEEKWYAGMVTPRMLCAGYPDTGGVGICHVGLFAGCLGKKKNYKVKVLLLCK